MSLRPLVLSSPRLRPIAAVAALVAVWFLVINRLRVDWSIDPQYGYGWLVPFFCVYLFWKRWPSRPDPPEFTEPSHARFLPFLAVVAGVLAFSLLPTRVIMESSPDWRFLSWTLALIAVGLTLAALIYMGGWATARHFAWPICFFLVAVPWPSGLEDALTQSLMRRVAALAAEVLSWVGVYALPQGNLIQLSTGTVGVDEACSGVRSLQSMLMASLFLGELNRFPLAARLKLVAIGLLLALVCNVGRTLLLVTIAIRQGLNALESWHDSAGFSILVISFVGLCLISYLFGFKSVDDPERPGIGAWRWPPVSCLWGMASWIVLVECTTEGWYRLHETPAASAQGWVVRWPESWPTFRNLPITPIVRNTLVYNEGRSGSWTEPDGSDWHLFAFKWYPSRTSTQNARVHRPEICLPGTGRVLIEERPVVVVRVGALDLPFRTYRFDNNGAPLHVFFCLWEPANRDLKSSAFLQDWSRASRLQRVWAGQRNLGQQSMEVIVSGIDSPEAAEAAFRLRAAELIAAEV